MTCKQPRFTCSQFLRAYQRHNSEAHSVRYCALLVTCSGSTAESSLTRCSLYNRKSFRLKLQVMFCLIHNPCLQENNAQARKHLHETVELLSSCLFTTSQDSTDMVMLLVNQMQAEASLLPAASSGRDMLICTVLNMFAILNCVILQACLCPMPTTSKHMLPVAIPRSVSHCIVSEAP